MRTLRYFLPLIFFLFVTGCIGPLKVDYKPGQIPDTSKAKKPLTILLKPYMDSRTGVDPKYVGKINSTVSDIHDDKIVLDRDVAAFVTEAVKTHLTSAGFNVTNPPSPPFTKGGNGEGDAADIIISGEVKKFRLDIGGRDEIEIELATRAIKGGSTSSPSGKVIWEGVITEKDDRYAGVFGNSRKSIGAYISKTLSRAINKTIAEININIAKGDSSALPQNELKPAGETHIPEGSGRLFITTEPARAKIYIGDVYYGLSPLSIDIEPAVYDMAIRLEGFKEKREKVAVRKGQRTELEIKMERE
ncbi:MAG: PEGA domain-containing protein [Nitrospinae bacterium]|nr:PEGA domain-containing protein [Nitrospinota bacterium]MBI3815153.1 PEGA domain-containing protein [Nitrospinota bacterium]